MLRSTQSLLVASLFLLSSCATQQTISTNQQSTGNQIIITPNETAPKQDNGDNMVSSLESHKADETIIRWDK